MMPVIVAKVFLVLMMTVNGELAMGPKVTPMESYEACLEAAAEVMEEANDAKDDENTTYVAACRIDKVKEQGV